MKLPELSKLFKFIVMIIDNRHIVKMDWIKKMLESGKTVIITTYGHAIVCKLKHLPLFSIDAGGVYIRMGKRKDCISFANLSAY